ncbi:MMB_0454 family protein [Mycoplasmopsis lipofaciens]|uniref:MMB_0454 family protein n=1 Tax=Mycoplasmopsis lipofaciens TaxID=114884 RepID=UPI000481F96C|nr:hypothetical protein [Mycoplasmopsis lipofaciens]
MNIVTINCGLNQTYSITEDVFQQLIEQSINDCSYIKLDSTPRVSFVKDQSNVSFVIDVKIKKNKNIQEVIENFKAELEQHFISLLDIKPQSVRICFNGFY